MTLPRLAGVVLVLLGLVGCSSGGPRGAEPATTVATTTVLKVAEFPAAVRAVEAAAGGPVKLVEVNATPEGVNVFVAPDPQHEISYFYQGGTLGPAGEPAPISSAPFSVEGIDLGLAATLVERTQAQFPGSVVVETALLQLPYEGLRWALRSRSSRGGLLNVFYTPTGDLVSVLPAQ